MKISIITVCYNSEKTIADTLKSIAAQDYQDIEHIIIDGASKDQTQAIARSYPHVKHLLSEPDQGLYDAMNKGIARATGQYIAFLNADDYYAGPSILSQAAQLLQASQADTLYGDLQYIQPEPPHQVVRHWKSRPYQKRLFRKGWMPPHPTFFARRELFERYGAFDLSFRSAADYELMLRFLYRYGATAVYLPQVMVKMRTGGLSNASLRHRLRANREDRRAWTINGLNPNFLTLVLKPLSKLPQYLKKPKPQN